MIILDLAQYPVPSPEGPCTYCGVSSLLDFEPMIFNGIGGGFVSCPECDTNWWIDPVNHKTTVYRMEDGEDE